MGLPPLTQGAVPDAPAAGKRTLREARREAREYAKEAERTPWGTEGVVLREKADTAKRRYEELEAADREAAKSASNAFLPPALLSNMKRYFWSRKAKVRASAAKALGDPSLDPNGAPAKQSKRQALPRLAPSPTPPPPSGDGRSRKENKPARAPDKLPSSAAARPDFNLRTAAEPNPVQRCGLKLPRVVR